MGPLEAVVYVVVKVQAVDGLDAGDRSLLTTEL